VRLSDAEREQLFEALKRHAAAGRLDVAELERRVAAVAAAQTREEVASIMADLPPLPPSTSPAGTPPRPRPRWGRGHGHADQPAPDWQPTGERFRDPRTSQVMRVWVDAAGGRHYVPDHDG
jgi:Domain of unknown function (DUF1707)